MSIYYVYFCCCLLLVKAFWRSEEIKDCSSCFRTASFAASEEVVTGLALALGRIWARNVLEESGPLAKFRFLLALPPLSWFSIPPKSPPKDAKRFPGLRSSDCGGLATTGWKNLTDRFCSTRRVCKKISELIK